MSKTLNSHLNELAIRQSSKSSAVINKNLDLALLRLTAASRRNKRPGLPREINEQSLRVSATSLGLDCWSDEPTDGIKILSITGKIIVIDVGFDVHTNIVKSCTLVLASEDGLQEEILADGRETMFKHLTSGRLELFTQNLKKLAFLDKNSDPSKGINLFHAQDVIRDAMKRKLKSWPGIAGEPFITASHLDVSTIYDVNQRDLAIVPPEVRPEKHSLRTNRVSIEIEEQPVAARLEISTTDNLSLDDIMQKPILRCPKTWVDASGIWLPNKQLGTAHSVKDLRYVLIFDPPVAIPTAILGRLANGFAPKLEADPMTIVASHYRKVHTPAEDQSFQVNVETDVEMNLLERVAFAHPKEIPDILSITRQFVKLQALLKTYGSAENVAENNTRKFIVKVELVSDTVSVIDDRLSVKLSIYPNSSGCQATATILLLPDATYKCWHESNSPYFTKAIDTTEDILISLIATFNQGPFSSPKIVQSYGNTHPRKSTDYRRHHADTGTRTISANEAKHGYNYTVPVDSKVETKSGSSINVRSPGYLAALGSFLRAQDPETRSTQGDT